MLVKGNKEKNIHLPRRFVLSAGDHDGTEEEEDEEEEVRRGLGKEKEKTMVVVAASLVVVMVVVVVELARDAAQRKTIKGRGGKGCLV